LSVVFASTILVVGFNTFLAASSATVFPLLAEVGGDFDARGYALNHTTFDGSDSYLFSEDLLATIPHVRYVHSSDSLLIPSYRDILSEGGDCKAVSTLFSELLSSVGYFSVIDCDYERHHCVTSVAYTGLDPKYASTYAVVDLTRETFEVYNSLDDHWVAGVSPIESRSYRGKLV
jgi:hypothetical protein